MPLVLRPAVTGDQCQVLRSRDSRAVALHAAEELRQLAIVLPQTAGQVCTLGVTGLHARGVVLRVRQAVHNRAREREKRSDRVDW